MEQNKLKLRSPAVLTVPVGDAERLLAAASGDAALLYLYLLKNGGELDEARAAFDLRRSQRDVLAAAERLRDMGILGGGAEKLPLPAEELPQAEAADVTRRTADSDEFKALVAETQGVYGRLLSTTELKTIFGIYDYLALPPDVIMLLIHHCAEEAARRYGPGKKPSFRTLEKEAYSWVNREIVTYERAEAWLAELERRDAARTEVCAALGIRSREPSQTERRYLDAWLDMGFSPEALAEAYDRTVTNTGELKWRYMDGIVRSWDAKGLHSPEEIAAGDKKPPRGGAAAPEDPGLAEFERMKKLHEKIRNG